jgi:hypothetical protein
VTVVVVVVEVSFVVVSHGETPFRGVVVLVEVMGHLVVVHRFPFLSRSI